MYLSERFIFWEMLGLVNFLSCRRRKVRGGTAFSFRRNTSAYRPAGIHKDCFLKTSLKISVCWQVYDMLPKYMITQPAAKG